MRKLAMKSALSARLAESSLTVVDDLTLAAAKTREVRTALSALGVARSALIVIAEANEDMKRASANLPEVRAVTPGSLNLLDVLKYRHLILTRPAAEALTEQLLKAVGRGRPVAADGASDERAAETGASVPMEEAALSRVEAGESADVAEADAAEDVASASAPDASSDEDGKGDA
jgi:hypothetical protein